jgi:hypothetical protein
MVHRSLEAALYNSPTTDDGRRALWRSIVRRLWSVVKL